MLNNSSGLKVYYRSSVSKEEVLVWLCSEVPGHAIGGRDPAEKGELCGF